MMPKTIEAVTVEIGVEPSEAFYTIANALGFIKIQTCENVAKYKDDFACSNCDAQLETINPTYGYENIQDGNFNYCPNCGAKVVS